MALKEQARAVEKPRQAERPARVPTPERNLSVPAGPQPAPVVAPTWASPAHGTVAGLTAEAAPQTSALVAPMLGNAAGEGAARRQPRAAAAVRAQGNARIARQARAGEQALTVDHVTGRPVQAPAVVPAAAPPGPGAAADAAAPRMAAAPASPFGLPAEPAPTAARAGSPTQAVAPAQVVAPARADAPAHAVVPASTPPVVAPTQPTAVVAPAGGTSAPPAKAPAAGSGRGPHAAATPTLPGTRAPGAAETPVTPAGGPAGAPTAGHRRARSPYDDPGFRATVARAKTAATGYRRHGSAHGAAAAAQAAAPGPANEVRATAGAHQVAKIDDQHPKEFDKESFAALLRSRVAAKAPRNPVEAKDFPTSGKLGELKTEMTGAAKESAADAGSDVSSQVHAAPDQSGITPKPVTPLAQTTPAPPPGDLGAVQAAPKPLPAAEVSAGVNAQQQQLDDTYAQAAVTDEQLAASNEPTFTKALADKQAAGQAAAAMPAQYRAGESATIAGAQAQAVAVAGQQTAAMRGEGAALLGQVTGQQHGTMAADQASRAKVTADLEQIYDKTRQAVQARLDKLDKDVVAAFDAALTDARQAFESYVQAALDERYSSAWLWAKDKLLTWGLPDAVQAIFDTGRARFIESMDVAIDRVSGLVADGLNEAKQLSAAGRKEVSDAVGRLSPALRAVGQEAAQGIGAKFDALDQNITAKRDQLVDTLAAKYQDGLKQLDDRIAALQSEHAGFLSRALSAVTGVIATILEMKNLLLKVLAKAIATIKVIIADPIRFLGNLVDAVGLGIRNFVGNILTHLKQGFFEWLFGEVAKAGITLPKTWDLKGIFGLVMQILGLTWVRIRKIAVEVVGEPIVQVLETAAEPIMVLIREGPAGLWNWIKEQLGNLKAMVVDQLQSWLITNVIKAGITWLIGLLNPASAFIKACKAIYDILQFIWTHGKQILEFISAVVDSIAEIAAGSLGKAAQKVEDALAKAIPVTIGFLAGLLGLGDLSETIKDIIEKIQEPVHAAVKWIITKAVALVKAAGRLLGFGKDDKEKGADSDDPEKEAKIAAALAELDERDAEADTGEGVDRDQAETIAATTRANHPILTSVTVSEAPERFYYIWTSSPPKPKPGPKKKKGPLTAAATKPGPALPSKSPAYEELGPEVMPKSTGPELPPYKSGKTPLKEGDIDAYKAFNTKPRSGDELEGHEIVQAGYLKAVGEIEERGKGPIARANPSLAVGEELHDKIGAAQKSLGLHDSDKLASMSHQEIINTNIKALEMAGVERSQIETVRKEAGKFADERLEPES
jgi:hypothetical protein